ncbi:hypothetical protein V2G26_003879 [Clonostachys chloroleuca]
MNKVSSKRQFSVPHVKWAEATIQARMRHGTRSSYHGQGLEQVFYAHKYIHSASNPSYIIQSNGELQALTSARLRIPHQ